MIGEESVNPRPGGDAILTRLAEIMLIEALRWHPSRADGAVPPGGLLAGLAHPRMAAALRLIHGRDPHHVWETAFHAIGEALRDCMQPNPWRIGKNNPYYGEEGIADASLV